MAKSACGSSRARRPSRTIVWSSARSMRMGGIGVEGVAMSGDAARKSAYATGLASAGLPQQFGQREFGGDGCTAAHLGIDAEVAAEPAHPFFHAEKAHAAHGAFVKAAAIVLDGEDNTRALVPHVHLHITGAGMAGGVVGGFLHDAGDAGLVLIGEVVRNFVGGDTHAEPGAFADFARVPVERGEKAEIVEHGGSKE